MGVGWGNKRRREVAEISSGRLEGGACWYGGVEVQADFLAALV